MGNKFISVISLIIFVGCIETIISCFIPFAVISVFGFSQTVAFSESSSDLILIIGIIAIILMTVIIDKQKFSIIPAAGLVGFIIYKTIHVSNSLMTYGHLGTGAYIMIIGGIITLIGALFALVPEKKEREEI